MSIASEREPRPNGNAKQILKEAPKHLELSLGTASRETFQIARVGDPFGAAKATCDGTVTFDTFPWVS